jgi:hypothetical protein
MSRLVGSGWAMSVVHQPITDNLLQCGECPLCADIVAKVFLHCLSKILWALDAILE